MCLEKKISRDGLNFDSLSPIYTTNDNVSVRPYFLDTKSFFFIFHPCFYVYFNLNLLSKYSQATSVFLIKLKEKL